MGNIFSLPTISYHVGVGKTKRRFAHPTKLLAAGQGYIFAAINGGRDVRVFDANGALLSAFPAAGADAALSGLSLGNGAE